MAGVSKKEQDILEKLLKKALKEESATWKGMDTPKFALDRAERGFRKEHPEFDKRKGSTSVNRGKALGNQATERVRVFQAAKKAAARRAALSSALRAGSKIAGPVGAFAGIEDLAGGNDDVSSMVPIDYQPFPVEHLQEPDQPIDSPYEPNEEEKLRPEDYARLKALIGR